MAKTSLSTEARRFADETTQLLNRTVTSGVRITAAVHGSSGFKLGAGLTKTNPFPSLVPLSLGGKANVFLAFMQRVALNSPGEHLMTTTSTVGLYTEEQGGDESLIFGIDYTREKANKYPQVHMHVSGHRSDLNDAYLGEERKSISLRDLHLPVGEKRFRPTLEDVVEFAIVEQFARPRDGWADVIAESRGLWRQRQTKALVSREQSWAAEALRNAGWDVKAPPSDK